jgi:hypothetical protein
MHWFDEVQRANLAALAKVNPHMASRLRSIDALYLYGTIGSEAALLRDGTVRVWSADRWPNSEEYTERNASSSERVSALVLGAKKWPELRELLPSRPAKANDCTTCAGSGEISGVICPTCDGLGWIPPAI